VRHGCGTKPKRPQTKLRKPGWVRIDVRGATPNCISPIQIYENDSQETSLAGCGSLGVLTRERVHFGLGAPEQSKTDNRRIGVLFMNPTRRALNSICTRSLQRWRASTLPIRTTHGWRRRSPARRMCPRQLRKRGRRWRHERARNHDIGTSRTDFAILEKRSTGDITRQ